MSWNVGDLIEVEDIPGNKEFWLVLKIEPRAYFLCWRLGHCCRFGHGIFHINSRFVEGWQGWEILCTS